MHRPLQRSHRLKVRSSALNSARRLCGLRCQTLSMPSYLVPRLSRTGPSRGNESAQCGRLERAIVIDERAALMPAPGSWGRSSARSAALERPSYIRGPKIHALSTGPGPLGRFPPIERKGRQGLGPADSQGPRARPLSGCSACQPLPRRPFGVVSLASHLEPAELAPSRPSQDRAQGLRAKLEPRCRRVQQIRPSFPSLLVHAKSQRAQLHAGVVGLLELAR